MSMFRYAIYSLVALQPDGTAGAQPDRATVIVWSFGFAPRAIHLNADRPVALTFVNRSGSRHDFTAPEFFAASRVLGGRTAGGEVELDPRETTTVVVVPQRGIYSAHCSHFLHKQLGMSAEITVD